MMFKKLFAILLLCSAITFILVACSSGPDSNTGTSKGSANQVHMNNTDFVQKSVTIKKGESITLISDTLVPHIIANGTWENNTPKPAKEQGAPEIKDVQIAGNSSGTIGPFNTAGTYKLYCTIHPGMNLTVVVQ